MTSSARPYSTPREALAAWLADSLTWDSFQSMSDEDMADSMLAALTDAGYSVVSTSEPCPHDWIGRGSPDDSWRECFLCGQQQDLVPTDGKGSL